MSDVSVGHSDEQVRCKGNFHSLGEWRCLVSYQVAQSRRTGGHSDMTTEMCSRRIRCECKPFHHCDRMCSCLDGCKCRKSSTTVIGLVLVWVGVFHHCDRMCSCLDGWAFLTSRSDVSAEIFHHCDRIGSCLGGSLSSL